MRKQAPSSQKTVGRTMEKRAYPAGISSVSHQKEQEEKIEVSYLQVLK